jgi:hypothetical protein
MQWPLPLSGSFSIDFFDSEEAGQLGISIRLDQQNAEAGKFWDNLESKSDAMVIGALPRQAEYPKPIMDWETGITQFRCIDKSCHPKMLAQHDRSITFVGYVSNSQIFISCEILAPWVVMWIEARYQHHLSALERIIRAKTISPRVWNQRLTSELKRMGLRATTADPSVWVNKD